MGIIISDRSWAEAALPSINADNTTLRDLLGKLSTHTRSFIFSEDQGCIVIAPVRNRPLYLSKTIPSFRTGRAPIELQSYYLKQALEAVDSPPNQGAVEGTVSSISASPASPDLGPLDLRRRSVQNILCTLAIRARSTVWVATPKTQDSSQWWCFLNYRESEDLSHTELRLIIRDLR